MKVLQRLCLQGFEPVDSVFAAEDSVSTGSSRAAGCFLIIKISSEGLCAGMPSSRDPSVYSTYRAFSKYRVKAGCAPASHNFAQNALLGLNEL